MPQGFVYILVSPNSNYIKIGGTKKPISDRIREINSVSSYARHGPWGLSDFLHVKDWQHVESALHQRFHKKRFIQKKKIDVAATRELFDVAPYEARKTLRQTSAIHRVGHKETEKVFGTRDLKLFLFNLFQLSGLFGCFDIQGAAWTLNLSGRFLFSLNIGPHAVACSERRSIDGKFTHYLSLDRLILDYPKTLRWLEKRNGGSMKSPYAGAKRAEQINFDADFAEADKLFSQPGIRRALVAYWFESLADLRQRNARSKYWRHHSYDAVSELMQYRYETENIFHPTVRFGDAI